MKRLVVILFLSLLWIIEAHALSEQQAKDNYFKGRDLNRIEGIWLDNNNTIFAIYKSGSNYIQVNIRHATGVHHSGENTGRYSGSESLFYGSSYFTQYHYGGFWGDKKIEKKMPCNATLVLTSFSKFRWTCESRSGGAKRTAVKVWPESYSKSQAKSPPKKKEKKMKPSSGTAFFVTRTGHLITNYHVVKGCKDKSKIVFKNKEYPVKLIAKDKILDFALLKVDLRNTPYIALSDKPPKKLQRIVTAGYPLGKSLSDDLKFTSGIISSLKGINDDSTLVQIDAALNPGNSGGPIVDESSGELIAVAVSGLRKDMTEAVNFGIKTNSLKNFLDSNQIVGETSKLLFSFGSVDVSEILENATVYTFCK